jgi:predicted RNase H-like nuclease
VFPPPPRALLAFVGGYADANAWMKRDFATGLQKQVWNLLPKLLDVDAALIPATQRRVREAHPEFAFARLAGRALAPKRSARGRRERLALLRGIGLDGVGAAFGVHRRAAVAPDDVLDAAVCCWLAGEIASGRARRWPERPPRDSRGLRMEIWGV